MFGASVGLAEWLPRQLSGSGRSCFEGEEQDRGLSVAEGTDQAHGVADVFMHVCALGSYDSSCAMNNCKTYIG